MKKLLILIAAFTVSLNNAAEIKQSAGFSAAQLNYLIKDTLKQEHYNNDTLITNWQPMGVIIHRIVFALYCVDRLKSAIEEDNSLESQYLVLLQEAQRCLERFDAQKLIYINQVNMYCGHAIAIVHPNFELAKKGKIKIKDLQKEAGILSDGAIILENEALISQVQSAINHRLERFIRVARQAQGTTTAE